MVVEEDVLLSWILVVFIQLVNGVVRKVHVDFAEILPSRCLVFRRTEPGETFIGKEGVHRVEATNDHVESQVKLEAI